jgi:RNA 2',3'-cyclic 3'-phosphodiesterase
LPCDCFDLFFFSPSRLFALLSPHLFFLIVSAGRFTIPPKTIFEFNFSKKKFTGRFFWFFFQLRLVKALIRTFIALELDPGFTEKIRELQDRFSDFDLKFVDPELVHITLKFLGDVDESTIPALSAALDSITCEPFEARVGGLGFFPKPANPKVLWLGAAGNFRALHDDVENLLKPFKFEKDIREFTAHATLARVKFLNKDQKIAFINTLKELKDVELGSMWVDKVVLKKSTLTSEGPIYETLHTAYMG